MGGNPLLDEPSPGTHTDPRTLTIAEAAAATGVTEKTIRRMVKAGTLPAIRKPISGGFKYLIPDEGLAHIAHEVGDRVLPSGVVSPLPSGQGGVGTHGGGYPGVSVGEDAVNDLRRDRDAWRKQAEEAQQALARLQEALAHQQTTIDSLIMRALPEPRPPAQEQEQPGPRRRRGFWEWFFGR